MYETDVHKKKVGKTISGSFESYAPYYNQPSLADRGFEINRGVVLPSRQL